MTEREIGEKRSFYGDPPQYSRPQLESRGYDRILAGQLDKALYGIALAVEKTDHKPKTLAVYRDFCNLGNRPIPSCSK
jgi:hypothetical protein